MSTTIKVLIVLNFVMVLAFMFIMMTLYATNENWKRRWNEDTKTLSDELKGDAQFLANESFAHIKAENRISIMGTEIGDLNVKIKTQEEEKSEKDKQIQAQGLTISKNEEEIQASRQEVKTLSSTLELTRQSNAEETRKAAVARAAASVLNVKLSETEDDYNKVSTALTESQDKVTALTKDGNTLKAQLATLKERHPKVWDEVTSGTKNNARFLRAVVAAVPPNPSGQQDLVMLTIGKGEQVEEGQQFIIFRGNKYIVTVRAEQVLQDMVNCRVVPDSWNDNHLPIQINDLAQNRLF